MKEPTKSEFPLGGLNLESLMDAVIYRDEFLSIAGHELKTPLTSLKLQTQVFKRSIQKKRSDAYDKDKVDRLVDQIERHTGHMSKLIEQMLDVCKLRAGRFTLTEQSFDLSHALRSYLKCHELHDHKIEQGITFKGDEDRLLQVVGHLLDNARKYGKNRGVFVGLRQTKRKVLLSVKDEGPGITLKKQKDIFHCFGRGIAASEVSGLGLGLYLCREIVEGHGGKISVKSSPGKGAQFNVELPLQSFFSF